MVPRRVVLAFVAVLLAAGPVGAAPLDRSWPAGARIESVDTTAAALAAGLDWTPRSCEGAVLWIPWQQARFTFHVPAPCPRVQQRGVSAVGTTGSRVLFLTYAGAGVRLWKLWTVTPGARRPRLLRFARGTASAPPIVVGNGGDQGVPYAVGRDVVLLGDSGARAFTTRTPRPVVSLAENAYGVAAVLDDGSVFAQGILPGTQSRDYPYPDGGARAVRPISGGVVVETQGGIELRRGDRVEQFPVPAGSRLVGYDSGSLVYARANELREYVRSDKRDVLVRTVTPPFVADFDRRGLAWTSAGKLCWSVAVYATPAPPGGRGC